MSKWLKTEKDFELKKKKFLLSVANVYCLNQFMEVLSKMLN